MINNKFLYGLMKIGARQVLIGQAEKKGIPWRARAAQLMESERLKQIFDEKYREADVSFQYPGYYTQPFHAYSEVRGWGGSLRAPASPVE
jgi:hypothetical protein